MEVLDERVKARRVIFNHYVQALGDIEDVQFMPELEDDVDNRPASAWRDADGYHQRACEGKY
ncbi:hypothetical protein [Anoxybacillus kestanbolensis]|uniref:hypothetical protein n=1 Tax=Anoxybacillus kestanbolensis TaxID=227476 RepID=UPI003D1CA2D9